MRLHLAQVEDTARLGSALAFTRPPQAAVHLHGDLGAGKSTLARALLRGLGVTGSVRSPTYTLIERYPIDGGEAWHLDLYRLGDAGELDFLGLDEAVATLWLIEWPEKGRGGLPRADLEIFLEISGQGRDARLVAGTETGQAWLARLSEIVS
ncbi:tRNA (adenosine(37)-N6)-threonylcarbamoyltransferase complex ATPase subunit type 1 TsaE [Pseudoxanthomonas winnipegensis]|uniref:tRNA threonylcarbamoyladenosine biosynthesis protein TsaE n=1 Tax=Pseudoxanthomonas winnipegensis TaxID=2480810 RepID=A0A4Q8LHG3_9GAMM|nr:tRNA (adenosine(37)-N6)-threonylcarbamoyltransferase complex ATPase subunit type 1 TsaE [Pseudoxanthomonas winnipegensis]TAA28940.1 tRNA (adenosine(37)-N6)-threonylcarbamoyltransferase complex ATPase subunit type 1 TsaE [Pseudoxanthomonas winnipegensis]TBV73562.1 tRNA (adenosine(37)-N6)-threonylcarbamoyltransferase complex ATPase subunit type 1 TsaE [Pseudoxanthomonas winnipegensis]